MCGIAGFFNKNRINYQQDIKGMCQALQMRGPDTESIWTEQDASVVLGHRRLAVVDLSEQGTQPMLSYNQRFVMTYNGEVYNFRKLREELQKGGIFLAGGGTIRFKSHFRGICALGC